MSEFEDRDGNLLHGKDRRRATKMDGMSRNELHRRDRFESREPEMCPWCNLNPIGPFQKICGDCEDAEEEARRRDEASTHFPPFAVTVRIVDFGSLKALVSIKMGEMTIRGFKVIEKPNGGRYVAPPSREVVRDGKAPEYFDLVRFDSKEATQKFRRLILDAYEAELEAQAEEEKSDRNI